MNVLGMVNDGLNAPFTGPLLSDMTDTENGVKVDQYRLSAQEIRDMEMILRTGNVGYAYVYPYGTEGANVFVMNMSPENIANFIGQHRGDCSKIVMTDRMDMLVLNTYGEFIDRCPDRELLLNVLTHLVPIQCGKVNAMDVRSVPKDIYDLYDDLMEVVQANMRMQM